MSVIQGGGELPAGAIRWDYLRSFGNCVIDTGVGNGASTTDLDMKGKYWFRPTAAGQALYYAPLSNSNSIGLTAASASATNLDNGDGNTHTISGVGIGSDRTFEITNGTIKSDSYSATLESSTLSSSIKLFGNGSSYGLGDLEGHTISIGGAKVADLIPCTDPLGVPAFYNKITKQYCYNTGSGALSFGNYAKCTARGSFGSTQYQGLAIYGNIAVRMANNSSGTTHRVYTLGDSTITELTTFTLSGTGHSNALQFAPTLEAGQTLPYLYVADIDGHCYVLSFDSSYQATIVQTITISGETCQVLVDDEGYVWASRGGSNSHRYFAKYRKVLVSEGASVTLTSDDKLDEWETYETFPSTYYTAQGWKVKDGRLYFVYGGTATNAIKGISVYDTTTHRCVDQYDFTKILFAEPEDIDFYNGQIVLANYTGTSYYIDKVGDSFNVPDGYTRVQYVTLTGSQSVSFGVVTTEATFAFEADVQLSAATAQMRIVNSTTINCQMYVNGSLHLGFRHAGSWKGNNDVTFDASRHRVGVDYLNKTNWFDGTIGTFTGSSSNSSSTDIGLGVAYSAQPRLKGNLYGGKVWRDNILVRDLVFYRDSSNNAYAWDTVRGVFRTITGTITLGPDC